MKLMHVGDLHFGKSLGDFDLTDDQECTVDLYDQMIRWYRAFLDTPNGKECIEEFDRILPEYTWMSSVKKIDFYLWSIRE